MPSTSIPQVKAIRLKVAERKVLLRERYGLISDLAKSLGVSQGHLSRVSMGELRSDRVAAAWNEEVERWRAGRESAA